MYISDDPLLGHYVTELCATPAINIAPNIVLYLVGVSYGSSSWSTARAFLPSTCSTWAAALSSRLPAHQLPTPLPSLPHRCRRCSCPPLATFSAQRASALLGLPSSLSNYPSFAFGSSLCCLPSPTSSSTLSTLFPPVIGTCLPRALLFSLGGLSFHHSDCRSLPAACHTISPYPFRLQRHRRCSCSPTHSTGGARSSSISRTVPVGHSRCPAPGRPVLSSSIPTP